MTRRLTVALVALVAVALLVVGAGALIVTRATARNQARTQLLSDGEAVAGAANQVQRTKVLEIAGRILKLEDVQIIGVGPTGELIHTQNLAITNVDTSALLAGETVSGFQGNLAYAIVPFHTPALSGFSARGGVEALVLTRQVGSLGPGWVYLILVGGLTMLVAAGLAALLSRRIARPLVEASETTGRIARGEPGARVAPGKSGFPEINSLAESINSMASALEVARDRESQLLLSVSHDLRTPLTSIRGYAEAIADGVAPDDAAAATVIVTESRRLERLVSDLLDLAKLQSDHLSLHLSEVDLGRVASEAVDSFRQSAGDLVLTAEGAGAARADADRMAQVIGNLVQNAIRYARTSVTVTVSGTTIVVADDGPGIPPAELDRVFDRFYQVDRGDAARSGLGLAIVSELVRAMGGTVRAESGPGTRMIVTL